MTKFKNKTQDFENEVKNTPERVNVQHDALTGQIELSVSAVPQAIASFYAHSFYTQKGVPPSFSVNDNSSNRREKQVSTRIDNLERENHSLTIQIEKLKMKLEPYERDMSELEQLNDIKNAYLKNMVQSTVLGGMLNCTRQNINRLRREYKLIAVNGKNGHYFPTWQIDPSGQLYGFIDKVISIIGVDNQWTQIQFFHTPSNLLEKMSPITYLAKSDAKHDLVVKAAEHYNEQSY